MKKKIKISVKSKIILTFATNLENVNKYSFVRNKIVKKHVILYIFSRVLLLIIILLDVLFFFFFNFKIILPVKIYLNNDF